MKNKAFSLPEVLIALSIIIFLSLILFPIVNDATTEQTNKIGIIKAHNTMKEITNTLLNNSKYYTSDHNFAYNLDSESVTDLQKFRNAFKSSLTKLSDEKSCKIITAADSKTLQTTDFTCFVGFDNITWGIPDTDFRTINIYEVVTNGLTIPYVPITVYINYNEKEASEDQDNYLYSNAIIYGLRRDGKIIFLDAAIDKTTYPEATHYQAKEYIVLK